FSTVRIVWRSRAGQPRSADIVRELVPPETVFSTRLADMLVLRVTRFSSETSVAVAAAIEAAMAARHPPTGLVFDLRGNRGGLLAEAAETADELLSPGLIAIERGRDPDATRIWRSSSGELARDVPVIVVVDGRTASAAEVLAAALADRGRAVVIGSATLGKGLVQAFTPLPGGGELFVTWSRILAPLGWPIQGLGVLPQVCTSLGEAALEQQLADLTVGQQPMAAAIARTRAARAPIPPAEVVSLRDPCPAAIGREIDLEAAHYLIDNPTAYAAALLPPFRGSTASR
ncbi:MAG: S41 family peptidase, partial [Streptosporangiaceae bacterium]